MNFEDWLRSSLPALLRYATALCGPGVAEEIVQDVAIRVQAQWSTTELSEYREAYARKLITQRYLSWRRRWSRLIPQSDLLDHPGATDPDSSDRQADRAVLIAELDRLPRNQLAVLVLLRYIEGLTDAEIVHLLNSSEPTVRRYASRALSTLGVQPTVGRALSPQTEEDSQERTEQDLRAALNALADQPVQTAALFDSITGQINRRRRKPRRTGSVLALATVALMFAIAIPQFLGPRVVRPDEARVPGNWNLMHRVQDPPNGWVTVAAVIRADVEITVVGTAPMSDLEGPGCNIQVAAAGQDDPSLRGVGQGPVTVQGQPGFYSEENSDYEGGVSWPYAQDAWANVACRDRALRIDKQLSIDVAEKVVFKAAVTKFPFRLSALPDGYALEGATPYLAKANAGEFAGFWLASADEGIVSVSFHSDQEGEDTEDSQPTDWETETINGLPAKLSAEAGELVLSAPGHSVLIKASRDESMDEGKEGWPTAQRELLVETAENLTVADDFSDRSTWYELNATLPR